MKSFYTQKKGIKIKQATFTQIFYAHKKHKKHKKHRKHKKHKKHRKHKKHKKHKKQLLLTNFMHLKNIKGDFYS